MEEKQPLLNWDHRFLYINEKPFTPYVYEGKGDLLPPGFNAVSICLPSQIDQDLDWKKEALQAEEMIAQGARILWRFDFGITEEFDFEDELTFYSLQIAVDTFTKKIWPRFRENTLGVCLYRGYMDISPEFLWTETQIENFENWKNEKKRKEQYLFCTEVLIHYLRLFSHRVPDEVPLFVQLDTTDLPLGRLALLASQERWEHFFIAMNHPFSSIGWKEGSHQTGWIGEYLPTQQDNETNVGICLPSDESYRVHSMEKLFERLHTASILFRPVPESFLSEMWDGLDSIILPKVPINEIPKRMLEGFCAAGGTVVLEEGTMNLESEVLLEEFLMK